MSVWIVNISLLILGYVMLNIIVFLYWSDRRESRNNRQLDMIRSDFGTMIANHLALVNQGLTIPEAEILTVRRRMKDSKYLEVFNDEILLYDTVPDHANTIKKYLSVFEEYLIEQFMNTKQSSPVKYSYLVHIYGVYRFDEPRMVQRLMELIDNESIYVRVSSLRAIGKIGNIDALIQTLQVISFKGIYFNQKIIIDVLDSFDHADHEYQRKLFESTETMDEEMICMVITHLMNVQYRDAADTLLGWLKQEQLSMEIRLCALKYFERIQDERIQTVLNDMLGQDSWQIRAVAAKVSANYISEQLEQKLYPLLRDSNWFVRFNAAMTVIQPSTVSLMVERILTSKDRYEKDIIIYALFNKQLITYEQYREYEQEINRSDTGGLVMT